MSGQNIPLHGRNHLPGGSDPIPTASAEIGYDERILSHGSLVAYWPLSDADDPALDVSGNAQHLTIENNTPTYQQQGPLPGTIYPFSVAFNGVAGLGGTQESLRRSDGSGSEFAFGASEPLTLEVMAYPTSAPPSGVNTASMIWLGDTNQIRLSILGGGYPDVGEVYFKGVTSGVTLNLNTWTHVVGTFDGTTANIYFDGELVGTGSGSSEFSSDQAEVGGGFYTGTSQVDAFIGNLAHAAVYNVALTADEVAAHSAGVSASSDVYRVNSAHTVPDDSHDVVVVADGTFTVTLPAASSVFGKRTTVKNAGVGTITVGRTGGDTIDGAASNVTMATTQMAREFTSDGVGWHITAGYL